MKEENQKTRPLASFRNGKVSVSVWKQTTKDKEQRTFYTMTTEKRYLDNDDNWQSTNNYTIEDANNLLWCVGMARDYIYRQKLEDKLDENK